ncbi:hypothetical protein KR018_003057 [Drosophila ironensis]|nr:hypothetical protein KR018_003057 [Drosophila ironensis]
MLQFERHLNVNSEQALVIHWRIFRLIGVHPPEEGMDTIWGGHYTVYAVVWTLLFHVCMSISMVVNFLLASSLESLCDALCVAMPHTLYMLKLLNVWQVRHKLLHTHSILRHLDTRLESIEEYRIVGDGLSQSRTILRVLAKAIVSVFVVGILYIVLSTERTLMYPSWIPWNWKDNYTVFVATVVGHCIVLVETAVVVFNVGSYPGTYLILLSVHIRALAFRLARLGHAPGRCRESAEEAEERLVGYIRDHQKIVQVFQLLRSSLTTPCFLQFFCTACAQCAICYLLMFERMGLMPIANLMCLLVSFTGETLLLCYTSELVNQAGDELLAAAYACNWLQQPVAFRRLLVLVLFRCQRAMILVVGIVVPVRMTTFLTFCKGAYSMLTLLNKVRSSTLEKDIK